MTHAFARLVAVACAAISLGLAGVDILDGSTSEATPRALIGIGWAVLYVAFKIEDLRGEK